jgi:hypothetical protein
MVSAQKMKSKKDSEYGQSLVIFAGSFFAIMVLMMLMVDFGGAALCYHRAQIAADSAAFAAAQKLDLDTLYTSNQVELDPGLAGGYAGQYASLNGNNKLRIVDIYFDGDKVWVTGIMTYRTIFAHAIGIANVQAKVVSSAVPGYGVTERGQ